MEEKKKKNYLPNSKNYCLFSFGLLFFFFFSRFSLKSWAGHKNILYKKLVIQLKSTHLVFVNIETKFWILLKLVILYEVTFQRGNEGNFGINSIQIFEGKICRKPGSWIEPVIFSHLKTGDPVTVKRVGFVNKCRHAGFSCDHVKKVLEEWQKTNNKKLNTDSGKEIRS